MKVPFATSVALNAGTAVSIKTAASTTAILFVTKATLTINTHAVKFIKIRDTNGTPKVIATHNDLAAAAGVPSVVTWDFGKKGIPLTAGKDLECIGEAAGTVGYVYAEGYEIT